MRRLQRYEVSKIKLARWLLFVCCFPFNAANCGVDDVNIRILSVGKLKEKYMQQACLDYVNRIKNYVRIEILELKETNKQSETKDIVSKLRKNAYKIALDVSGNKMDSIALSKKISDLMLDGRADIDIVIGGSDGYLDAVGEAVDLRLSFSDFTFPHQLMRLILLEQLYRSFKIIKNEVYHK